jgi:polar amino acid transport system substrate-binding protein
VGAAFTSPPRITADADAPDVAKGLVPDLLTALEPILGVKFTFVNTPFTGQLPGLASGKFDILAGNISDTADREKSIADMVPYSYYMMGLLLPKANPRHITDVKSACGAKIGVPTGSTQTAMLDGINKAYCSPNGLSQIQIANFQSAGDTVTAVLSGQIDSALTGYFQGVGYVEANPNSLSVVAVPQDQVTPYVSTIESIAIDKSNPGVSKALVLGLNELVANGTYDTLMKKWGLTEGVYKTEIQVNPITNTPVGTKA